MEATNENTQVFKTPIYQRKAYKDYYNRKKEDPIFKDSRKQQQKVYYEKNKIKIIAKIKERTDRLKAEKNLID
tara:strand:- start:3136 stop:3354 length:219 start_codon:yes stop_codon:yes gene_type:complete